MRETVSAFINKVTGEGFLTVGAALFNTSNRCAKVGSLILIVNPTFSFGEYQEGDILRVTHVDIDSFDGSIYADTQGDDESLIYKEEYVLLIPANLEASVLSITMSSGKSVEEGFQRNEAGRADEDDECEHFDQLAEYADEVPEVCEGCGNREDCYVGIDFDEDDTEQDEFYSALDDLDEAVAASCEAPPTMDAAEQFFIEMGVLPMTQKFLRVKALNTLETCDTPMLFKGEEAIAEFVELEDAVYLALIKRVSDGKVLSYGMSQCNPEGLFYDEIGKVIALYRAGGKEVPNELIHFATYGVA